MLKTARAPAAACYTGLLVSGDTKWIIGTVVVLAALLSAQMAGQIGAVNDRIDDVNNRIDDVNNRIDDLRAGLTARIDRIETRLDGIDERLRNVEIAFGKVDQRLLTLERILLPPREPAVEPDGE